MSDFFNIEHLQARLQKIREVRKWLSGFRSVEEARKWLTRQEVGILAEMDRETEKLPYEDKDEYYD